MKRLLAVFVAALAGCSPKPAHVKPVATPLRIVSLAPSVTEMLFALGAGPRTVAADEYSNYPPEAARLPRIGASSVNYEAVLAQKPDLVIGVHDLQGASLKRLRELGLSTLELDTTGYDKTIAAIRELGDRIGERAKAGSVCAALVSKRSQAASRRRAGPAPSVLFIAEAQPSFYVAGQGTFIDEMIRLAGGTNAAKVAGFTVLSRESLVSNPPGVVLCSAADVAAVRRRVPASTRVLVPAPDILVRPGPRLGDGLLWLSHALFPAEAVR